MRGFIIELPTMIGNIIIENPIMYIGLLRTRKMMFVARGTSPGELLMLCRIRVMIFMRITPNT